MEIKFIDINPEVTKWLSIGFYGKENVKVYTDNILNYSANAIVSPANSFGFMDGGIDLIYTKFFGSKIEKKVKKCIQDFYNGELLVGQAITVKTQNNQIPILISAPTMRVPENINNTPNVYLAFKSVLFAVKRYNEKYKSYPIQSILCPGLGTATGSVDPNNSAFQMRIAYEHHINPPTYPNLSEIHRLHEGLKKGQFVDTNVHTK